MDLQTMEKDAAYNGSSVAQTHGYPPVEEDGNSGRPNIIFGALTKPETNASSSSSPPLTNLSEQNNHHSGNNTKTTYPHHHHHQQQSNDAYHANDFDGDSRKRHAASTMPKKRRDYLHPNDEKFHEQNGTPQDHSYSSNASQEMNNHLNSTSTNGKSTATTTATTTTTTTAPPISNTNHNPPDQNEDRGGGGGELGGSNFSTIERKRFSESPNQYQSSGRFVVEREEAPPPPPYDNNNKVFPDRQPSTGAAGTTDNEMSERDVMGSLPEGVQLPPSVDSDLLGDRLLSMLLQLPVEQINEALTEYDDAVRVKCNIRNHQAYLHGVLKRYLSVLEKSRESGAKPMGSEITEKVMLRMKELVDDNFCTDEELIHNERILSKIKMLPEHEALSAIEELAGANRAQIRNFGSYFMGILNRYMRGEKLAQRSLRRNHGHRDYRSRRYVDDDRWDDDRGHFNRRNYHRDRSWSPGRDDIPPRRGRGYYNDDDEYYDTRDRSRSRERYEYDNHFEPPRGRRGPFRRARNYSPPYQRLSSQEPSNNTDAPESHDIPGPSGQNARFDPSLDQASQTRQQQTAEGQDIAPMHSELAPSQLQGQDVPNGNPTSNETTAESTSNRLNASLPTSRWQPPSEIQESSNHHYREERGYSSSSSRRPPPFDRRPVDPAELDISDTVQTALKNITELGIVKGNLGYSIHRMISELPEEVALDALDAFCSSDMGRVRNREGYLVGILKKHAHRIGVTFSR